MPLAACLPLFVAVFCLPLAAAAGGGSSGSPGVVAVDLGVGLSASLGGVFERILGARCPGVQVVVTVNGTADPCQQPPLNITLLRLRINATALGPEAYAIRACGSEGSATTLAIEGGDALGVLFGAGRFLHTSNYTADGLLVPSAWRGEDRPHAAGEMRAAYLATHFNNYFQAAPVAEVAAYIEDLALWGLNTVIVTIPLQQFASFDDPACVNLTRLQRAVFAGAKAIGLAVGLIHVGNQGFSTRPADIAFVPFPDPQHVRGTLGFLVCPAKGAAYLLDIGRSMVALFDQLDVMVFWPYDEGGCGCSADWPWGARGFPNISAAILAAARERFPGLRAVLSSWMFDQPEAGEFDGLDAFLRGPGAHNGSSSFSAVMADNHGDFPAWPLAHHGAPGGVALYNFPEISMWGRYPWGGYGANPLPTRFQMLWNETQGLVSGGAPYSEGIYNDMNMVMALRHYWDPASSTADALAAYASFEFGPDAAAAVAQAVAVLEANWDGARPGASATAARAMLQTVNASLAPAPRAAWRWRLLLLRAQIDEQLYLEGGRVNCSNPVLHAAFAELAAIYHAGNAVPAVRPPCT